MRATEASCGSASLISSSHGLQQELTLKREQQQHFNMMRPDIPQWLSCQAPAVPLSHLDLPSSLYSTNRLDQQDHYSHDQNPPPPPLPHPYQASAASSPHMSATALLQKAAQMGATMSRPPQHGQMASHTTTNGAGASASSPAGFGLGLAAAQHDQMGGSSGGFGGPAGSAHHPPLHQDMMMMNSLPSATPGYDRSFEEALGGVLGSKRDGNSNMESAINPRLSHGRNEEGAGNGGGNDGLTRDFLGLRALSHRDILNLAGLDPCMSNSSYEQPQQSKKPWHG